MTSSIEQAVREIDSYIAREGWDGPVRVFALIKAATALAANPDLAGSLPSDVDLNSAAHPDALFSVEQENLPPSDSIEHLLAQIAWPPAVDGAAIALERVTLPPEAEEDIPADPVEAENFIANDPRREDIRMVVGVMREGEAWCTIRMRSHDTDAEVLSSANLVPEMIEAMRATFL